LASLRSGTSFSGVAARYTVTAVGSTLTAIAVSSPAAPNPASSKVYHMNFALPASSLCVALLHCTGNVYAWNLYDLRRRHKEDSMLTAGL
jgi:hypothetical protein